MQTTKTIKQIFKQIEKNPNPPDSRTQMNIALIRVH